MEAVPRRHIGQRYPAVNAKRFVVGTGAYVADLPFDDALWMAVLRSPHAHARIVRLDATPADGMPGVRYVVTGEEIAANTMPIPRGWDTDAVGARGVDWYALCTDRVRYVGEAVAAVVADTRYQAREALAAIEIDYDPLPAVTDARRAREHDAPLVEEDWGTNVLVTRDLGAGDPAAARAEADGLVSGTLSVGRVTGVPLEPRGMVASYDADADLLTLWDSTQNPHPLRVYLAETLGIRESAIRVIQPHVGGAFGLKQPTFQEEPLIAYVAMRVDRPVRWIEERTENFQATGHAREMRMDYQASYLADGTITGLEVDILADVGAPTALVGWGMTFSASGLIPGPYAVPNYRVRLEAVVTNKCPWNAYRGFGRDASNWWLERIVEHVARATGVASTEVRLRNFIPADAFPFSRQGAGVIDSGDYPASLRSVMEMIGTADFAARRAAAQAEGRLVGIGVGHELSSEGCAMPGSVMISGYDGATVRVAPSGDVTVLSGVTSPGNGNETALAQIAADTIGCAMASVTVVQGDTLVCPWGLGNYSSRSTILGGSAVQIAATDLRNKILSVASRLLEVEADDLDVAEGVVFVRGAESRSVSIVEVATQIYEHPFGRAAIAEEPGLESTRYFRAGNIYHQPATQGRFNPYPTWPSASAAVVVEVDAETGRVRVLEHCLVDDSGTVINPRLVEANLHGAVAQAIGGALYEQLAYDGSGQLMTATLMDYTIPTAVEVPVLEVRHQHSPSPFTPLGTKGAGESGIGCTLAAITAAVEDAIGDPDLQLTELPLLPSTVWAAIHRPRDHGSAQR